VQEIDGIRGNTITNKKIVEQKDDNSTNSLCVGIDYQRYQHYLDNSDLNDAEKQQVIQALWNIIVNFVDLGIGVHPIQQTGAVIDDNSRIASNTFQLEFDPVKSEDPKEKLEGVDI